MPDPIITVENLGKRYQLRHQGNARYQTLRDTVAAKARQFLRPPTNSSTPLPSSEEFWALRDVNFEIQRGDVVGIIGRNGAGKSTLLKILSRITEPSTGRIRLRGRVASLLEVGTGFHAELSGRENIFLNGAILGMTKAEIRSKFDEIVAFAEVEKFLDTPVKHYSSGMYVRLAFAVAAHLDPEILVVDEVLAVGDATFQSKCIGKMQSVSASNGRTIIFVSHHMPSLQRLCRRAILLRNGMVALAGDTASVINSYTRLGNALLSTTNLGNLPPESRRGTGRSQFTKLELTTLDGHPTTEVRQGEPLRVRLTVMSTRVFEDAVLGFSFVSADGNEVMGTTAHDGGISSHLSVGETHFECVVDPMPLCPGRWIVRGGIFRAGEVMDHIDDMASFEVLAVGYTLNSAPRNHRVGMVYLPFTWSRS
jgi:lipopolysaccharide transport system ATP-binding protein